MSEIGFEEFPAYHSRYCIPLFFLPSAAAGLGDIIYGATCTLVETPKKQLFVTSYHVWNRFLEMQRDEGVILAGYLGKGYNVFELSGLQFLDGDYDCLDLAILHAPEADYLRFVDKKFFRIPSWPIPRAQVGEPAFVVGYPRVDRQKIATDRDLGYTHFSFHVSSVSDRHFVLANEKRTRVYTLKDPDSPEDMPIEGMSGSPGFVIRDGIEHLVGFLYEGKTSQDSIFLVHAQFLQADGTLDHSSIPY